MLSLFLIKSIMSLNQKILFIIIITIGLLFVTEMITNLKKIGLESKAIIDFLQKNESNSVNYDDSQLRDIIFDLSKLYGSAMNGNSIEALGDMVDNELAIMDKAIEEAANRIEVLNIYCVFFPSQFLSLPV